MDLREGLTDQKAAEARNIPVLCWHEVAPGLLPASGRVSPARFKLQIDVIAAMGFRTISLAEWVEARGVQSTAEQQVLLCFDDAYCGVLEHAFPMLRERGMKAALFPVLAYLGRKAGWDPATILFPRHHMTAAQLKLLLAAGWELGLHGLHHLPLDQAPLQLLDAEIVAARARLELEFDCLIRVISWPFGLNDRRCRHLAEAAGLKLGLGRFGGNGLLDMPRHMLYSLHGPAAVKRMLSGTGPDRLQGLAALGAGLSAEIRRWLGQRKNRSPIAS